MADKYVEGIFGKSCHGTNVRSIECSYVRPCLCTEISINNKCFHPRGQSSHHTDERLAGEELRSRDRVSLSCTRVSLHRTTFIKFLLTLVSIISDTRISCFVRARERYEAGRFRGASTRDFELMATWIDLRARVGICAVQSNDFVADEVVARGETLGNSVSGNATRFHERCVGPCVGCAIAASFLNLEPDSPVLTLALYRHVQSRANIR
jgi:hypothetical protein